MSQELITPTADVSTRHKSAGDTFELPSPFFGGHWFSTINGASEILEPIHLSEQEVRIVLQGKPGLVQFSVVANASCFDWSELYFNLDLFNNKGQKTGPWDFDLRNGNKPLVPSFWVTLNGRELGLWFFQRVTIEDLRAKRFRGHMVIEFDSEGTQVIEFRSYRRMNLHWESVIAERAEDDFYIPARRDLGNQLSKAKQSWQGAFKVDFSFIPPSREEPLNRMMSWVLKRKIRTGDTLWMIFCTYAITRRKDILTEALAALDRIIELPYWGNPQKDGYSHNGDVDAASNLQWLAVIYSTFSGELGEARSQRLLAKLADQGDRFLEVALLNRDYWGGSLLQDHGWRSMFAFGISALHLLNVVPQAERWVTYIVPRLEQALEAMPLDGVIPLSSYGDADLYLPETSHFRDLFLILSGIDLYKEYPFPSIVSYLFATVDSERRVSTVSGSLNRKMVGGSRFLNQMAAEFGNEKAASLNRILIQPLTGHFYNDFQERRYYLNLVEDFCSYRDENLSEQRNLVSPPARQFHFYDDSGLAYLRNEEIIFSVRCGPWCGYNAYRKAPGPCDRMGLAPGSGHFVLEIQGQPFLVEPEEGYRLHSNLRSCLLIDGTGQEGDIGYPMSIPGQFHHGEEIRRVEWRKEDSVAEVSLNLAPAYPKKAGVLHYSRDFIVGLKGRLICRDYIVLDSCRTLTWLFHGDEKNQIHLVKERAHMGTAPSLAIEPVLSSCEIRAAVHQTDVVWSYVSAGGFKPFHHVRYDSAVPVKVALVEFLLTW